MANVANINFRADAALKEEFAEVVEDMGLTVTTALTVRERALPFWLKATNAVSPAEREMLEQKLAAGEEQ